MPDTDGDTGPYLPPGTRVRYGGWVEKGPEFGVVVDCWLNPELAAHDCLVAFFGGEFPVAEPAEPPYIQRYVARSLVALS